MNNHVGSNKILIFLGLERRTGGGGPTLFSYDKNTGEVRNEGALFGPDSPFSWSTGEGWYFSATQPNTLYVNLNTSPQLQRYDVISHTLTTVLDVTSRRTSSAAIAISGRSIPETTTAFIRLP
jgi:hypothetical protein